MILFEIVQYLLGNHSSKYCASLGNKIMKKMVIRLPTQPEKQTEIQKQCGDE